LQKIVASAVLGSFLAASHPAYSQSSLAPKIDCPSKNGNLGVQIENELYCTTQFGIIYDAQGVNLSDYPAWKRIVRSPEYKIAQQKAKGLELDLLLAQSTENTEPAEQPARAPPPDFLRSRLDPSRSTMARYTSTEAAPSKKDPSDNLIGGVLLTAGLIGTAIGAFSTYNDAVQPDCKTSIGNPSGDEECVKARYGIYVLIPSLVLSGVGAYFIARDR
jgi:hypothetical protein